jgi:hypothetical protein
MLTCARVAIDRESARRLAAGDMLAYPTPPFAHDRGDDAIPMTPIDTFTATWDGYDHFNATKASKDTTYEYINDSPGGCTWPLRRKLLDLMPVPSEESEDSDNGDELEKARPLNCTKEESNGSRTLVDGRDFVSHLTDDLHAIDGEPLPDGDSSGSSIEYWIDGQPKIWIHDTNEVLARSDFRICHNKEHDPYTLRMLYLRTTAPALRRASSVVTVLRVDERNRTWDLDENRRLVRLQQEVPAEHAGNSFLKGFVTDLDHMSTKQLIMREPTGETEQEVDLEALQQKYTRSILRLLGGGGTLQQDDKIREKPNGRVTERSAPEPRQRPARKFRLKKKSTPQNTKACDSNAETNGDTDIMKASKHCPKYKMAQYVRSLEERLGQLSLREQPSLEERLARLSLRDNPLQEGR